MKNKGLLITLIILLLILVIGLVWLLVFCITGNMNFRSGVMRFGTKSSTVIFDETYETNNLSNIEILSEAGDVTFEKSTDENIRVMVYGKSSNDIKVTLSENKLKVDYTDYKREWFIFGTNKNDIIVYIPSSYSDEINIKNDYGNCSVTSLENATLKVDCNCGNVEVENINSAIVKCDYGNVEINSVLNKCDIKCDCGNVEIDEVQIQEDSSIKCDLGNVVINKTNDIYIDADVDLGNKTIKSENNRNSDVTLKIKADCGNVTVGE